MDHMKPRSSNEPVEPYSPRIARTAVLTEIIARECRVTAALRQAIIG
jgi:hypothetical protein